MLRQYVVKFWQVSSKPDPAKTEPELQALSNREQLRKGARHLLKSPNHTLRDLAAQLWSKIIEADGPTQLAVRLMETEEIIAKSNENEAISGVKALKGQFYNFVH